jgi:hypothetical protein
VALNALEDYKKQRDEEKEVSTAEKNKEAEKKATLLLARSIAIGKISRAANNVAGADELLESPEVARDLYPDDDKVDDNLDLVSEDMELDGGGDRESWHSSGDEDEDAARCECDDAAGASAPTVSRSRFLKRARGADAMRATKAHKKRRTTAREMVANFQDKVAKSLAAADDGRKALTSSMANGLEAMVSELQNKYEDRPGDSSVIAIQAQTQDTMV